MSRDALIVGINSYQHLPDLKAPALDAEAIAQRLEEDGDFDTLYRYPEAISQLEDKKIPVVSRSKIVSEIQLRDAITQLFLNNSDQAPKTALFYFSGHGISDPDGFDKGHLTASDTTPNALSSRLSLRWLHWVLSESPIEQQIVWLDCCHSGSLIVNLKDANPGYGKNKDRCFIASSRDFEASYEDLNSDYSVFTKALLDGLVPSRSSGGKIDNFELAKYVKQTLKGQLQTPVCTNFGKAINLTEDCKHKVHLTNDDEADSGICPYKGLEFFDCNDEDPKYFFGREQLVGQLLEQARTSNFMALVGASGNGKSSVLRAGLLHQLKLGQRISGSDQWQIRITRPDRQPMQNLALTFVEEGLSVFNLAAEQGKLIEIVTAQA